MPGPTPLPRIFRSSASPSAAGAFLRGKTRNATGEDTALCEWHLMTSTKRADAWIQLCEWVAWLHDRYELSVEERLPACWPQHPGLIEELRALKAWREEIYRAAKPSGQAARYWHAEMRQTISAATTFYAAGCRAGHCDAPCTITAEPEILRRWCQTDPWAGIPPVMLNNGNHQPDTGEFVSAAAMSHYLASERAVPFSQTITDYLHYDGSWWQSADGGWLQVTSPRLAADLDRHSAALAVADSRVAHATIRNPAPDRRTES